MKTFEQLWMICGNQRTFNTVYTFNDTSLKWHQWMEIRKNVLSMPCMLNLRLYYEAKLLWKGDWGTY